MAGNWCGRRPIRLKCANFFRLLIRYIIRLAPEAMQKTHKHVLKADENSWKEAARLRTQTFWYPLPVGIVCRLITLAILRYTHIYIYPQVVNYRLLAPVIVSVYIVRLLERWLLCSTILNGLLQYGDDGHERRRQKDLWRLGTRVNDQQRRATSKCQTRWVSPLSSQTMQRTWEATEMSKNLMWVAWAQDNRALKSFFK